MEKLLKTTSVAIALFFLSGCAEYRLYELDHTQPQGIPFTKALAKGYRRLACSELRKTYDEIDAAYFAGKGLDAAGGKIVEPEKPTEWNISCERMEHLVLARAELMHLFKKGVRERFPHESANAQVYFDCMVEESEEGQTENIKVCEDGFVKAMNQLKRHIHPKHKHHHKHERHHYPYVIHFDLNSSAINAEGMDVIRKAIKHAREHDDLHVKVLAHTDKIGAKVYNHHLSQRRAEAVKHALVAAGLPAHEISVMGLGELPGKLTDPHHRRAEIIFWQKGHHHQHNHKHHHPMMKEKLKRDEKTFMSHETESRN